MKAILLTILLLSLHKNMLFAQPETMWQLLTNGTIIKWAYADGDEFSGNSLDENKWQNCFPWGRNYNGPSINQEYMTDGNNIEFGYNSDVNSGTLRLIAKREDIYARGVWYDTSATSTLKDGSPNLQTWHYTSGMIFSKQKYKYGLFEIGAKWPDGKGFFPAFWLYGANPDEELDIIEYKGETPNRYHVDTHCPSGCEDYYNFFGIVDDYGGWVPLIGNLTESFNTIRAEWGNDACYFSINNYEFAIWLGDLNYQANIIANFSIAGTNAPFPPAADNTTPCPTTMEIDFIRVWTRLDCDHDITINNYNQTITDETAKTGKNINVSNTTLYQDQSLKLIATESITIEPNTVIQGNFEAKIVDCPNLSKSNSNYVGPVQVENNGQSNKNSKDTTLLSSSREKSKPLFYTKIFPNPSNGKITIEFEGIIDRTIKLELYNSSGNTVFSKEIQTLNKIDIDISNLSKGVYLLKGFFGDKTVSEKIILN
ncbi:MAG: hypothetical protein A2275_09080 [Bacteroidetes bacterium RIFOXYA12_FULL_35_11]|nr:MAG: hypothetical protein A2275_09080 [Bacteroidetes bacterium RIFOXYA12_FULL_35_11]OFY99903.1 MAG: hypothetical protein A2491_01330 [Bacteroidetes bacterium RIFOXYC12_FULL_35_7]HBX51179.1 hypothetical protein [Bacteroidales bacterium]